MAHYAVVDDFRTGMPQTIPSAPFAPDGIACHWSAGAEGETGALGTISFLIGAPERNASYHEVWYPKNGGFEARRIVRPSRFAHSMNPTQPWPWSPDARTRRILGTRWWNPNAASYAVCVAGGSATIQRLVNDPGFMAGARRRIAELQAQFRAALSPDPMFNHAEGQTNKSDWGSLLRPAILQPTISEEDMDTRGKFQAWLVKPGAKVYASPSTSAPVLFTFGASGGQITSREEEVTTRNADGTVAATGVWRRVKLDNDPRKRQMGWMRRAGADPDLIIAPGDAAGYDEFLNQAEWGIDLAAVPTWPLSTGGISEAEVQRREKMAARVAAIDVGKAGSDALSTAVGRYPAP